MLGDRRVLRCLLLPVAAWLLAAPGLAHDGEGGVHHHAAPGTPLPVPHATTDAAALSLQPSTGCDPAWIPTFGSRPGVDGQIYATTVFDDGTGPALYVGGSFASAGGLAAENIARWNGSHWSPLGDGLGGSVWALAVFDDGSGPALFAGGRFTVAGGIFAQGIAKWDGASWSAVANTNGTNVNAMTVFDDGDGPALYFGGVFSSVAGVPATNVVKWDGESVSPLGDGLGHQVLTLEVFDDGSGHALYAGGLFLNAGAVATNHVARWNGSDWSPLGEGVDGFVRALKVHDDGSGAGPTLHVGGEFSNAGPQAANHVARWNGASWSSSGTGTDDLVRAFAVFDDGTGPALHAAGDFESAGEESVLGVARWSGSSWSPLGDGLTSSVRALLVHDDGQGGGPALYVGGSFTIVEGIDAGHIARWDGTSWSPVGSGLTGTVRVLATFDDGLGGGPALYAGGSFVSASGAPAQGVARWDGHSWSPLGLVLSGWVDALLPFDDGSGPALYVAGSFFSAVSGASPLTMRNVARWNGASWSPLSGGLDDTVHALAVFDDGFGAGPMLYAGGHFRQSEAIHVFKIARWDGEQWFPVGGGVHPGSSSSINTLAAFDDGSGSALYAGGYSMSGSGGHGSGQEGAYMTRWTGEGWSSVGSGTNFAVQCLGAFDDGRGPALYAGGLFTAAGGVAASRIARWDGSTWSPLGGGVNDQVYALAVFHRDQGAGRALYVGGAFGFISDSGDSHLGQWASPGPWHDLGGGTHGVAGQPLLAMSGLLVPGSGLTLDLSHAAPGALALVFVSSSSRPTPFLGGTLYAFTEHQPFVLTTDELGKLHGQVRFPHTPAVASLVFQVAIHDPSVPEHEASLSNAVEGLVP